MPIDVRCARCGRVHRFANVPASFACRGCGAPLALPPAALRPVPRAPHPSVPTVGPPRARSSETPRAAGRPRPVPEGDPVADAERAAGSRRVRTPVPHRTNPAVAWVAAILTVIGLGWRMSRGPMKSFFHGPDESPADAPVDVDAVLRETRAEFERRMPAKWAEGGVFLTEPGEGEIVRTATTTVRGLAIFVADADSLAIAGKVVRKGYGRFAVDVSLHEGENVIALEVTRQGTVLRKEIHVTRAAPK